MKSVVASIGMFAAMANAYQYPRHMHFRRDNGTDASLTTLTVLTTQVHTVTSCAPVVTNCPANDQTAIEQLPESDKTTFVVTDTIVLTETVCPVTDAASISSSVIEEAKTGGVTGETLTAPLTASVPLSTGGSYPPITGGDSSPEAPETSASLTTITSDIVTEKTLTLTLGIGEDASVVTTTVQATIQTTITVPCEDAQVTDDGSKGNGTPDEDSTTTLTSTSTTTRTSTGTITKTVEEASPTETKVSANGSDECPEAKTVTVTAPASTVYITVGSDGSKTQGSDANVTGQPGDDDDDDDESNNGSDDEDDEEEYCDETSTVEATVTVVPYPVNSTVPTSGYARPTGFARRLR